MIIQHRRQAYKDPQVPVISHLLIRQPELVGSAGRPDTPGHDFAGCTTGQVPLRAIGVGKLDAELVQDNAEQIRRVPDVPPSLTGENAKGRTIEAQ